MRTSILHVFLWCILFIGTLASADEIWLKDGTHLIGSIEKYGDNKVEIKTTYLGIITVKLEDVSGINTDKPYTISTGEDNENIGIFIYKDDTQLVMDDRGEFSEIQLTDIDLVWAAYEARPKPDYWSGSLSLSIIGESADTDDLLFITRTRALRKKETNTLLLDMRFKYEIEDNSTSETNYVFLGRYDWDRADSKLHNFVKLEAEHDKFDELDLRLLITGGVARDIIKKEHKTLTIRGGLGWFFEEFKDDSSNSDPTAELGYEYAQTFRNFLNIEDDVRYDLLLSDLSDYRVLHEFAGLVPLSRNMDWQLKVSMINEYISDTSGEQSNWDTDYVLSLVYNW